MTDFNGLNWGNSSNQQQQRNGSLPPPSRSTSTTTGTKSASGLDSFASLLGPSSKPAAQMSMQERQKQLEAQKAKLAEDQRRKDAGAYDDAFWNSMGGQPAAKTSNGSMRPVQESEDDILAAFNKSAPVDSSSHFPPPQSSKHASPPPPQQIPSNNDFNDDDDDPFGLSEFSKKTSAARAHTTAPANDEDDDILGMLGKPVDQVRKASPLPQGPRRSAYPDSDDEDEVPVSSDPRDKALAELVDMGFPADKAREALGQTQTGVDVQSAVGYLLNQAHAATNSRNQSNTQSRESSRPRQADRSRQGDALPSWMKGSGAPSREDSQSPASRERDLAQQAQQIGGNLWKSANSLWSKGQKQVQRAMADFNQEGDSSQPKWMREAQAREEVERRQARAAAAASASAEQQRTTDEAAMLDRPQPPSSKPPRSRNGPPPPPPSAANGVQRDPLPSRPAAQRQETDNWNDIPDDFLDTRRRPSRTPQSNSQSTSQSTSKAPSPQPPQQRQKLNRQQVEEQASQAYVSSARRRKPATPQPEQAPHPQAQPAEELDIFNADAMSAPPPRPQPQKAASTPRTTIAHTIRPPATNRAVPSTSPSALSSSHASRTKGGEAYKRGDYAEAQTHYTAALGALPTSHPILIILHCNRALTSIKTGEPKTAVTDAEAALALIGPARGEGESIDLGSDGEKPMKDFFGKALMRKAEAYEAMEKWTDAGSIWREAVEAGVGGSVAIQGRNRCERAAAPASSAPKPAAPRRPAAAPAVRRTAASDLSGRSQSDSEAVRRLREANAAATKASDEQFALTDAVDAKLTAWKGTKKDNLRALLASLDTVLWSDAGWKSVGMGELVMPNRVKIVYMKAIGKVHPDKLSQTATTEQKMISAAVFATLNEAWDKFKRDNGM